MRIDRNASAACGDDHALMILLLMTIFGISTMDTNILKREWRAICDRNTAFQAAESALRAAEVWIAQTNLPDVPKGYQQQFNTKSRFGISPHLIPTVPPRQTPGGMSGMLTWWAANGVLLSGGRRCPGQLPGCRTTGLHYRKTAAQPGKPGSGAIAGYFRYLSAGDRPRVGGAASTVVVLQTVYKW